MAKRGKRGATWTKICIPTAKGQKCRLAQYTSGGITPMPMPIKVVHYVEV
jgi:hypothetical protein